MDTAIVETILPGQTSYPIGLSATFDALAAAQTRILDAYVQGFNADTLITATMSGGWAISTWCRRT